MYRKRKELFSSMAFSPVFVWCLLFVCVKVTISNPISNNDDSAMEYLQKYGYMEKPAEGTASLMTPEAVTNAVMEFQRFAGLKQTGTMDRSTIELMNKPRCGLRDINRDPKRDKRFAPQGSKWKKKRRMTYRITKYPSEIQNKQLVDDEVAQALHIWSGVSGLRFIEKKEGRAAIRIRFERRNHGKCERFDGPGHVLAHAFFPQYGGEVHFDDEEDWTFSGSGGINMLQVAVHEFGHSLGLEHSDHKNALMAPFYNYQQDLELQQDDVAGIQMLYGPESTTDLCEDARIDAITRLQNGELYVFKGDFYWKVLLDGIAEGYPRRITDDWYGLPGNLDAAFTGPHGITYFFKGDKYWAFNNRQIASGYYPRLIKDRFPKIPNDIDAALLMNWNKKVYIFKGHEYWRYEFDVEDPVKDYYPLKISEFWPGIPMHIDAAFLAHNNRTYIFKNDKYYRYDVNKVEEADPPYPRSTAKYWFKCKSVPVTDYEDDPESNAQDEVEILSNIDP